MSKELRNQLKFALKQAADEAGQTSPGMDQGLERLKSAVITPRLAR